MSDYGLQKQYRCFLFVYKFENGFSMGDVYRAHYLK